jgi:4'-phosphopantetheinyl transferase EntD
MIDQLVPRHVIAIETDEELIEAELFPEEEEPIRRAVETRRREFVTARACAREALRRLGVPATGIPSGDRGEPIWPWGVRGSITHCRGYRACAVARSEDVVSIGIDAEVHEPLPRGVLEEIAGPPERAWASSRRFGIYADRLLFSAKEAVYKAWFPLTGRWLGFDGVELSVGESDGTFRADFLVPGPIVEGRRLTQFHGRWSVHGGRLLTAVVLGGR